MKPKPTKPTLKNLALNKFVTQAENLMKERIASLNRTGRFDNESLMTRMEANVSRVQRLADRGGTFQEEREIALAYIWDKFAELQNTNPMSRAWDNQSAHQYLEESPQLTRLLYGAEGTQSFYEEQEGWLHSDWGRSNKRQDDFDSVRHLFDEEDSCD